MHSALQAEHFNQKATVPHCYIILLKAWATVQFERLNLRRKEVLNEAHLYKSFVARKGIVRKWLKFYLPLSDVPCRRFLSRFGTRLLWRQILSIRRRYLPSTCCRPLTTWMPYVTSCMTLVTEAFRQSRYVVNLV